MESLGTDVRSFLIVVLVVFVPFDPMPIILYSRLERCRSIRQIFKFRPFGLFRLLGSREKGPRRGSSVRPPIEPTAETTETAETAELAEAADKIGPPARNSASIRGIKSLPSEFKFAFSREMGEAE